MSKKKNKKKNIVMLSMMQKIILTIMLIGLIVFMFVTDWFGREGGFLILKGKYVLENPVAALTLLFILWGIWYEFEKNINNKLIIVGVLGLIGVEVWTFLTWHLHGKFEYFNIVSSVELALPSFYIGFLFTLVILITSIIFVKK